MVSCTLFSETHLIFTWVCPVSVVTVMFPMGSSHGSHWFAQVQVSSDLGAEGTNLALQEGSPSQPHSYRVSSHSSTSLGSPALPLLETRAGRPAFPVL